VSNSVAAKIQLTTISLIIFLCGLSVILVYLAFCAVDWAAANETDPMVNEQLTNALSDAEWLGLFPIPLEPLMAWSTETAQQAGGYHYIASYTLVFILLVAGIMARFRFQKLISASERVKEVSFYLLFSSSLMAYTVIFPTVFFVIHLDQLHPIENEPIYLHDLQLFVIDQICRSIFFDFLEALRIPWSNLDYSQDADIAFKALVACYRFLIPASLLFVFLPMRRGKTKPPTSRTPPDSGAPKSVPDTTGQALGTGPSPVPAE